MMDEGLREKIAAIFGESIDLSQEGAHEWTERQADRILAIPEIAEAVKAYRFATAAVKATGGGVEPYDPEKLTSD
jgi:hypothetical protein